jgi:hypothetical protein
MTEKYGPAITQMFEIFDFRPWELFGIWRLEIDASFSFRIPNSTFRFLGRG